VTASDTLGFSRGYRAAVRLQTHGAKALDVRTVPLPAAGLEAVDLATVTTDGLTMTITALGRQPDSVGHVKHAGPSRGGLPGAAAQETRRLIVRRSILPPWASAVVAVDASASFRGLVAGSDHLIAVLDLIDGVAEGMGAGLLSRVALLGPAVRWVEQAGQAEIAELVDATLGRSPAGVGQTLSADTLAELAAEAAGEGDGLRALILVTDAYPADAGRIQAWCAQTGWIARFVILGPAARRPQSASVPSLCLDHKPGDSLGDVLISPQFLARYVADLVADETPGG
jgi:hypothetical protein